MRRSLGILSLSLALFACNGDDGDGDANGGTAADGSELVDVDNDGFYVNAPNPADVDCDDNNPAVNRDAEEVCNGVDDNCNDLIDDNATGAVEWYPDDDADGFGRRPDLDEGETETLACFRPPGFSNNRDDCNDSDDEIFPGAAERCNEIDDDCDAEVDEGLDIGVQWFLDRDNDGYGGGEPVGQGCSTDPTWVRNDDDCNDVLDSVRPGAAEICDGVDNDCDGATDDADDDVVGARRYYADADGDTYGNVLDSRLSCVQPFGFVDNADDCNDADFFQNPETLWYIDDDRDGFGADGGAEWPTAQCWQPIGYAMNQLDCDDTDDTVNDTAPWFPDADRDGFGADIIVGFGCNPQDGWVLDNTDCEDRDLEIKPGAEEICDGIDNNCDGNVDDADPLVVGQQTFYPDADGDGYGVFFGLVDACFEPPGFVDNADDCNDAVAFLNPDTQWYADDDRDGYGDPTAAWPTTQCETVPGHVLNTGDCDDTDATFHDFTGWYPDLDQDGLGTGLDFVTFGCLNNPSLSLVTGDCDDDDPNETTGNCYGEQLALIELTTTTDADAFGQAIGLRCQPGGLVFERDYAADEASTTLVDGLEYDADATCILDLLAADADPSADGGVSVAISVCGTPVDTVDAVINDIVSSAPFSLSACSGCTDPGAINYDPTVLVPTDSCLY